MKFPFSWLVEYINTELTPSQTAKLLTQNGIEVESLEHSTLNYNGVVVGRVLRTEKHPNADKLCVATVSDGTSEYQVVCGAPNCRTGLKTAFAKAGATIKEPSGETFTIKQTKLRGVESYGMLCSAKELQIGDEADGIMEFAEQIKEGTDLHDLYADTIFEVGLTPNLGHCASLIGIARELSAVTKKQICYPKIQLTKSPTSSTAAINVSIKETKDCPRYSCRIIKGVKIAPSPEWLQKRLIACGMRPINNIVDLTNYVVLEMGHPLHAFDLDLLHGPELIIRSAQEGETIVTLDAKERILSQGDLLICDQTRPVAIAGVMGALNSEVGEKTQNILIESAYFNPATIRRTSKRLGLMTDASRRFERGTDPNQLVKALNRVTTLIQEVAGGTVSDAVIDIASTTFPSKQIACRLSRINLILGTQLSVSEVETIFQGLELQSTWDGTDQFQVTIPTYRGDLQQEIDLIEEVARIYGYDNLPRPLTHYHGSTLPNSPIFDIERETRVRLLSEGLQEFLTCDLIGPTLLDIVQDTQMPAETLIHVLNPTSIEQSILRPSMLPGMLQLVKYNIDHQNHDISGFEIGRIHFKEGENFKERSVVGIVLSGNSTPHQWDKKPEEVDFFHLKGIIENFLTELKIEQLSYQHSSFPILHPGRQATLFAGEVELGSFGEVHPSICRRLNVNQKIYFAELNLHDLLQVIKRDQKMQDLPLYPCSERDWTLTLDEKIEIATLLKLINQHATPRLEAVTLKDLFRSEKIGLNKKNVTLHFVYRDREKTVEQEEVEAEHTRIINEVLKSLEGNG